MYVQYTSTCTKKMLSSKILHAKFTNTAVSRKIRPSNITCYIEYDAKLRTCILNYSVCALGYADNIALLAPSPSAMRILVKYLPLNSI